MLVFDMRKLAEDTPAEDLALFKDMEEKIEKLVRQHYDAMDEAITGMFEKQKAKLPLFLYKKKFPRFIKMFLTRRWVLEITKLPPGAELVTIVSLYYKGKIVARKIIQTILNDERGRCLGCGEKHR